MLSSSKEKGLGPLLGSYGKARAIKRFSSVDFWSKYFCPVKRLLFNGSFFVGERRQLPKIARKKLPKRIIDEFFKESGLEKGNPFRLSFIRPSFFIYPLEGFL